MKRDVHPEYRLVVFKDMSSDFTFLTRSTMTSRETVEWSDGNSYPLVKIDTSSESHPFYTGRQQIIDTAGRVDRYRRRYGK